MHPLLDLAGRPIVGHRGNRAFAPENTVESFRQALALGADAIELDVRATKDGEIVVIHDSTVDRTTDGTGAVDAHSWDEIRRLDAGFRFTLGADGGGGVGAQPYRGRGITVPTLAEVLETFPAAFVLIEIKATAASEGLRDLLRRMAASARCVVASFSAEALAVFAGDEFHRSGSTEDVARLYLPALLGWRFASLPYHALSIPRLHKGIPLPLGSLVRAVRPAGLPVHVWTVNEPPVAQRLWQKGVRGIITDDPGAMLKLREASP